MIVVLRPGATEAEVAEVMDALARRGLAGRVVKTGDKSAVHITQGPTRRARRLLRYEQVEAIVPTSGPRVRRIGRRFYPYHFVNWSAFGIALLGVLVLLAGQLPPGIGDPVDYRHPLAVTQQPWYLGGPLAFVGLFGASAAWLGWFVLALLFLAVLGLPLIDRSRGNGLRGVRLAVGLALALAVLYECVQAVRT